MLFDKYLRPKRIVTCRNNGESEQSESVNEKSDFEEISIVKSTHVSPEKASPKSPCFSPVKAAAYIHNTIKFRTISRKTGLNVSTLRIYHQVHEWAQNAVIGDSQLFYVQNDIPGEDTALMLSLSLNSNITDISFEFVYIDIFKVIFVKKDIKNNTLTKLKVIGRKGSVDL